MIPEGKDATAVTPELAREILARVQAYKDLKSLSWTAIAKGTGWSAPVISAVLNAKYAGDHRQVLLDLDRWLDDQLKIDAAPKSANFVWTDVAREIETVVNAAVELQTIGLIYGPETSGLGKTTTLSAIAADRPSSIFITVDKVAASPTGVLTQIAKCLNVSAGPGSNRLTFESIVEKLRGTSRLLIVDQIHNLCGSRKDLPFYVLADLHERTKSPQVWAGTSDVNAYLLRGQRRGEEPLSQIRSRIGVCRDLTQRARRGPTGDPGSADGQLFTIQEIRDIFAKNKMRLTPDAAKYLLRLANLPDSGALRSCKNLVVMATKLYAAKHPALTEDLLRAAHRMLISDESFTVLQSTLNQAPPRLAKVG
jgi:DNA transposition AAA+ family ATPase